MTSTITVNNHRQQQQPRQPPQQQQPPLNHQFYYSTTPSYFSNRSSSPSLFKGCCSCLLLLFALIALVIIAVILVIIVAVKPKKPHFDLRQVTIEYVGISPAVNGATLSLRFRLLFTAENPNTVGIKYGQSRFTVMYHGVPLGRGSVPGFYQPSHSVRNIETIVSVDRVNLMESVASNLVKDASMYDKVDFRVLGDVSAKIRVIQFDSPEVHVSVDCEVIISPRKQALIYKQCGFDGLTV